MALDILVTTDRLKSDPIGRDLVQFLSKEAPNLELDEAALYYDFPTYADYETVTYRPDVLILSRMHGIFAIRLLVKELPPLDNYLVEEIDESLAQFCSILIGRLLKSKSLRKDMSSLLFPVLPVVFLPGGSKDGLVLENCIGIFSLEGFSQLVKSKKIHPVGQYALAEARSVVEGAKALTRPHKRLLENPDQQKLASALSTLESEIANFDQSQRRAALVSVPGAQRIRGLAGSGKTVILAMKAAHLH